MKTKKRRNKRNNLNLKNYNFNQKNFVEKIYNKDNDFWELSLILSKEKLLNIIKLFSQNNENNFILETKKIITEIKNNNINLSAKYFDDNAIDAFAYTILKNISKYCDLFLNLGINQKIMINLYIENNMFIKDDKKLFQVIGEKTEEEIKIEPYSSDKYDIKGLKDYAEKIVLNENKKIIFKYQKDDHIIIILENHFAKLLLENILYKKYEDFKDWFIREIKFYITETNYFFKFYYS
ncbi:hypothetical protein [Spiroplasma endosymbiont of Colias croceus]|uniref:hypothetical protein n=1 Tax=Spiroplasma endosymbiont of Colias croceus TaxID=3066310 RepID=UPI0030CC60AF